MKKQIILCCIIFISVTATASSDERASLYDDFTPEKISSFTCSLIKSGEYYRAYVELLRINSYYPEYLPASVYTVTSNYLFYKSRRYNDLLDSDLKNIDRDIFIPASIFRVDSLIKLDRRREAESELTKLYESPDSKKYSDLLNKRSVYLSILNNSAESKFRGNNPEYEELFLYSDNIYKNRKNPYLGSFLGIVPGMGYVYAGEPGTGVVSMIIIGAGSAVTYASYRSGSGSLSLITGIITFFFYGGSIAGGYMQSVKYNDRLIDTLEMKLNRELMPERDLDEVYFKFGLNSNACK